jgi:hypothetical protein
MISEAREIGLGKLVQGNFLDRYLPDITTKNASHPLHAPIFKISCSTLHLVVFHSILIIKEVAV